ncbi:hypothetical protein [Devosia sp.]|uniref:hypothetical protein n=1 Tax=Devosia sp. TaxID=1871048 RepID=UPI00326417ED
MPLLLIVVLLVLKHVPATQGLPLARTAGVVSFGFAAFLALRLVQAEDPVQVDGWSELRPSMVEYFAAFGAVALAMVLLSAIIIQGFKPVAPAQMVAAFIAAVMLFAAAVAIGMCGLFVKIRWNSAQIEHANAFGRKTTIAWGDVRSVRPNWRGITIATHGHEQVTFSQFHSGAAHLAKHATNRARRNGETATKAFAAS